MLACFCVIFKIFTMFLESNKTVVFSIYMNTIKYEFCVGEEKFKVNQWKNTRSVLNWFNAIREKSSHTFVVFDVKDFYPSITETLLKEAVRFAKSHIEISDSDVATIFHARKSLLFDKKSVWIKKKGGLFDVTMEAYDGAEVCELVGTYMLSILAEKYNKDDMGLYRDDGLAVFKNASGPQNERIKKDFQKTFKDKGLDLVIECNKKIVNYLEITMNLNSGSHKPYHKPDTETNYIHSESDHPPSILKQLPFSVERRISELSSSEEIFKQAKDHYQEALTKSGYTHQLRYNPPAPSNNRRNRSRRIIWFNPPFSKSVVTNVGKEFLRLIDTHFPAHNPLHKIFNRNTVKVSYGCAPNIKSKISSHNKNILQEQETLDRGACNCQNPDECPLPGACTRPNLLYEGAISSDLNGYGEKKYKGISEPPFKGRFGNHKKSFTHRKYSNETSLSKEVWRIKDLGGTYSIKWKPIKQYRTFNPSIGRCALCMSEKLEILQEKGPNLLNKKSEIVSTCRHRLKYMLSSM